MRDWQEPAEEDEGQPLPDWVTRRWAGWGAGLAIAVVGLLATSHRWWTIPVAIAIGALIVGVHYVWWPDIPVSQGRSAAPLPQAEAPAPDAEGDDIVIVRRQHE